MDNVHKLQTDKLRRAYGEIIELKAEVALLKREGTEETMLNKSNLKEKVTFMLGYTVVMALILWALGGCAPPEDNNDGDNGTGGPPDPPPPHTGCDYPETEFNETWDTPNYVTTLPIFGEAEICGELTGIPDVDCFYFFLSPNQGDTVVPINFYVETDPEVITNMRLVRPIYNKFSQPTGDYDVIWNAFSHAGEILILDLDLEYDETLLFDLILEIKQGYGGGLNGSHEYSISFWSY